MKNFLIITSLTLMSLNAFAISDKKLVDRCLETAEKKYEWIAEKEGCTTRPDTLKLVDIDNRTLNPYKYLKWEMQLECPKNKEVVEMRAITQYVSYEKKCY